MGSSLGSSGLAVVSTLTLAASAILLIVADDRLRKISGYDSNSNLQSAHSDLITAQIFAWIATVFSLILTLGYVLHHNEFLDSEWLHLALWILAILALVGMFVFAGLALNKYNNVSDDMGAQSWTWAAIIVSGVGAAILILMGSWRLYHKSAYEYGDTSAQQINKMATARLAVPQPQPTVTTSRTTYSGYGAASVAAAAADDGLPPAPPRSAAEVPSRSNQLPPSGPNMSGGAFTQGF